MFLGYQNGKIALTAATREELESAPCMVFERIEEAAEAYVLFGGEYVLKSAADVRERSARQEAEVAALEKRYGLSRAVRTALLALRASGAELDETLLARVEETEAAALPLRAAQGKAVSGVQGEEQAESGAPGEAPSAGEADEPGED